MFKPILFLHIVVLVTANPLQGYVSYPLIQYKENYKNAEHPLFIQPSGSSSYVQVFPALNHLTPFQNIPISYNDYGPRMYMDRNIPNQRIGAGIDSTNNVNGYVSYPTDSILVPNIFNNFIAAPLEKNLKNQTTDCNKRSPKRKENNRKLQSCQNDNKEKKRNNQATKTNKNNNPSLSKRMIREEKNHKNNLSNNEVSKKNKCTNKTLRSQEIEKSDNLKDYINPNSKLKTKLTNIHSNLSELPSNNDYDITEKRSSIKTEKPKSKACKKERGLREIDGYFDITEDCSNLESRCVRNNYNNNKQKSHSQFSYTSGDYSNHINAYIKNLLNSQYTNLNSNFPFNFDHLYNMHHYTNLGTNESQKRQKKKKKTNKKKKQKKSNKKKSDPNSRNTEQTDCEKIVELSPTVNIIEKSSTKISKINNTDTALDENTPLSFPSPIKAHQIFDDVLDTNSKIYVYPETPSSYSLTDDFKEFNSYDTEDYTPFSNMYYGVDDYYPDFRSDFMYVSKEDDRHNFHERNYYFCDKSRLENCDFALLRESIEDGIVNDDQKLYPSFEKLVLRMPPKSNFDNDDLYRVRVGEEPNNDKILEDLNKEIIFITPPGLENPDFRTNMINKDIYPPPTHDIYYQSSNKPINTKMSTYSDVKSAVISGKINKFVDQNNVETNFGHSKVVKYGPLMPTDELNEPLTDFKDKNEEKKSYDDMTTLVIAESVLL